MNRKIKKYLKNMSLSYGWYEKEILTENDIGEMYLEHRKAGRHADHVIPKFYNSLATKLESYDTDVFEAKAREYISLISYDYSEFMSSYGYCCIAEQSSVTEAKYKVLNKLLVKVDC